jgi:hypothetical protein
MTVNPFDPERDPELGALLREALDEGTMPFLATRLRARVRAVPADRLPDILARWLRLPVTAAAAIGAVAALGALWWTLSASDGVEVAGIPSAEHALLADNSPAQDIVLARFLEDR